MSLSSPFSYLTLICLLSVQTVSVCMAYSEVPKRGFNFIPHLPSSPSFFPLPRLSVIPFPLLFLSSVTLCFTACHEKNFDKLQRVQNRRRAARIVCGVGRRQQSAQQLHYSLHWLPVRARTDFKLATFSYLNLKRVKLTIWLRNNAVINHSSLYVRRHRNC